MNLLNSQGNFSRSPIFFEKNRPYSFQGRQFKVTPAGIDTVYTTGVKVSSTVPGKKGDHPVKSIVI